MNYKYLLLFILLMYFTSCNPWGENHKIFVGTAFGSNFKAEYFGKEDLSQEFKNILDEVDRSVSTYRIDSEITQWNVGNDSMQLSDYFIEIASLAQIVYQDSDGYYDPTVKTLVEGWGFGNGEPSATLSPKEVDSLLQLVGYNKLSIDKDNRKIKKEDSRIQLDFNSIAPGFTAEKIGQLLEEKGMGSYLIDVGGEIKARGSNQRKFSSWIIGIEDPTRDVNHRKSLKEVKLNNESLATSGNYRKIKLDNLGNKVVHTINPKTGYPVVTEILSCTIIDENCAKADAYATTVMVMGLEKATEFLRQYKLKNYLILEKNHKLEVIEIK